MNCKICNKKTNKAFEAKILNKYNIEYFKCPHCGFLCTEQPYWLEEAYKNPINMTDTGILHRNNLLSKIVSIIIFFLFNKKGKYIDYAGGYGIFTRLMRDIGFDFYWNDPYSQNILAKGFESSPKDTYNAITSFESFEHFSNPLVDIEKMIQISNNIIFTTELLPSYIPNQNEWWYYGLEHGQHISFYSRETLEFIAQKYDMNFYSIGLLHIFTKKRIKIGVFRLLNKLRKYNLLYLIIENLIFNYVCSRMNAKMFSDMYRIIESTKQIADKKE